MIAINVNLLGVVFGCFGSMVLVGDVLSLTIQQILNTSGNNKPMWSSFENDTKPQILRRINTAYGAGLLLLSYTCQLLVAVDLFPPQTGHHVYTIIVGTGISGVFWFIKGRYSSNLLLKLEKVRNREA